MHAHAEACQTIIKFETWFLRNGPPQVPQSTNNYTMFPKSGIWKSFVQPGDTFHNNSRTGVPLPYDEITHQAFFQGLLLHPST